MFINTNLWIERLNTGYLTLQLKFTEYCYYYDLVRLGFNSVTPEVCLDNEGLEAQLERNSELETEVLRMQGRLSTVLQLIQTDREALLEELDCKPASLGPATRSSTKRSRDSDSRDPNIPDKLE